MNFKIVDHRQIWTVTLNPSVVLAYPRIHTDRVEVTSLIVTLYDADETAPESVHVEARGYQLTQKGQRRKGAREEYTSVRSHPDFPPLEEAALAYVEEISGLTLPR
jgi:hypothetical protein